MTWGTGVNVAMLLVLAGTSARGQQVSPELNRELPSWLRFSGDYRARFEGFTGRGFQPGNDDAYLLNRIRLNLAVQPASWLKFQFQGQDARVFANDRIPNAPTYQASMDLRMAYMQIGDPEAGPLSVRVGRQELAFGEQRLVGYSSWSNTARTFDAVRATWNHNGYRLDAFASSVVKIRPDQFDRPVTGDNLHGLYGSMTRLIPGSTFEPYLLWRVGAPAAGERGGRGTLDFKTIGLRWVGKLPSHFDYGIEVAGQAGSVGPDSMAAWAGHWVLGYTIPSLPSKTRLLAEYNYASGDKDPRDGRRGTFDSLYPTPHGKYGLTDQVGWRNIHDLHGGVEFQPARKWKLAGGYHSWWLASARDALYNSGGTAIVRVADGSAGTRVGQGLEATALFNLSPAIQLGAGVGHLFPGEFLQKATPGSGYTYPYVLLGYSF